MSVVARRAAGPPAALLLAGVWAVRPVVGIWAAVNGGIAAALVAGSVAQDRSLRQAWTQWDGGWFLHIAAHGYGVRPGAPAFYPLYPGALHAFGFVLGGSLAVGAIAVSLAASLGALALLHRFAEERFGSAAARRAVLLLALFPYALFLQLAYSEALYLLFALGAAVALGRRRLVLAGALTGLALLTRPVAVALVVAVVVSAFRQRRLREGAAALVATGAAFAVYPLLLLGQGRSWDAFLHVEGLWQRHLAHLGPLGGLGQGAKAAWAGVLQLTFGPDKPYWTPSHPDLNALINVTGFAAAVVALAALPLVWRRLGPTWFAYCVVALALPLAEPAQQETPLLSLGRFFLALFPVFVAVASLRLPRWAWRATSAVSAGLLLAVIGWWTSGQFVA